MTTLLLANREQVPSGCSELGLFATQQNKGDIVPSLYAALRRERTA